MIYFATSITCFIHALRKLCLHLTLTKIQISTAARMDYKHQHFVTEAYLRAWYDPRTPKGYEPYVWMVSKKDRLAKKKSPKKIFREADFYTIVDSKGNRNVDFEKTLQKIESEFITVRRDKIRHHQPLDAREIGIVAIFIATMFARVRHQRDQQREMWQTLIDEMERAPAEVLTELTRTGAYKQISDLKSQPLPYNIVNFTNIAVPFFSRMGCEILETETKPGFVTSDNPCFLIDPAIYTSNPPMSWHELFSSPTVEILFPISPKQLISLKPAGPNRYVSVDKVPEAIDEVNKITLQNAEEFIVLNQEECKDIWFENI